MSHQYNDSIAWHYASYRPDLHGSILQRLIKHDEHFKIGLDVGCGTGYSSMALSRYCDVVFGLDSNQSMLNRAAIHPKVSYVCGNGDDFSVIGQKQIDVVSFSGSLFYIKSNKLKSELIRTLTSNSTIFVYDFQLLIDDLMENLNMSYTALTTEYNYTENLDDWPEFTSEIISTDQVQLKLSEKQVSHILLANSYRYASFQNRFQKEDPFECLTDYLAQHFKNISVSAEIYFSRHCLL